MQKLYSQKELLFIGSLFLAAILSLFFFLNYRTLAFPEHNIKFDITREQASEKSKEFVSSLGFNPNDFKETTIFAIDEQSKTYLEREVGVPETARLAANDIDVWHFTSRFFKPLEKEEISVAYLPNGRLSGYVFEIDEAAKGANLSKALAQGKAEKFLTDSIHANLDEWSLVSGESIEKPNRKDHTFIWEKKDFRAKEATYRMEVNIYGDKIGGYQEYLKVPEGWVRNYEKETSNNDLAQTVAEVILYLVFGLSILITFITAYRKNNLRLVPLRWFGALAGIIAILTALNSIPLSLVGYTTTISWEAYIGSIVLVSILGGFFEGSFVYLILTAGEVRFRELFAKTLSLEASISSALKTKEVNKALLVGTFAGIIFFSYEILYYFLGKQIGFWAPADTNYTDIFSTVLPWIYPMFIGFSAAATEEGIFRLFGIPFLKKYVKKTWIAVLITAFVWGFLHSNYPQSPWFVRGIEIGLMGIVLGWLFVRFGFLANFTAHYTFNAFQTAIYFFVSGSLYASVSSTVVSLLPLIIALYFMVRAAQKKGFDPVKKEYLNDHLPVIIEEERIPKKDVTEDIYKPLSVGRRQILIGAAIYAALIIFFLYPKTSVDQVPNTLGRGEIHQIAEKTLIDRNVMTNDYSHVITFNPQDIATEQDYILDKSDFTELRKIYPDKLPTAYWKVRYFKPLQKEEYIVYILPNGTVYQVIHAVDEKAPGANISPTDARNIVETYLQQEKNYDLSRYKLVQNKADRKENRTDYQLVFEERGTYIDDAAFRTQVILQGSEVSGYSTYLKIPESWLREKEEITTLDFATGGILAVLLIVFSGLGFRTFLELTRSRLIDFKLSYKIATGAMVLSIISTVNSIATFARNYDTAVPFSSYVIESILGVVVSFVITFFTVALILGVFTALWKQYFGRIIPDRKEKDVYIKDALVVGYTVPVILIGISNIFIYALLTNELLKTIAVFDTFPQLDSYIPAVAVISEFPSLLVGAALIGSILLLLKKYLHKWKFVIIFLYVVTILASIPTQHNLDDMIGTIVQNVILFSVALFILKFALKKNLLAYALLLYTTVFLASGWVLFVQTNLFFKINGIVLLFLSLAPLLGLFRSVFQRK